MISSSWYAAWTVSTSTLTRVQPGGSPSLSSAVVIISSHQTASCQVSSLGRYR